MSRAGGIPAVHDGEDVKANIRTPLVAITQANQNIGYLTGRRVQEQLLAVPRLAAR